MKAFFFSSTANQSHFVCDGGPINRKFHRQHKASTYLKGNYKPQPTGRGYVFGDDEDGFWCICDVVKYSFRSVGC